MKDTKEIEQLELSLDDQEKQTEIAIDTVSPQEAASAEPELLQTEKKDQPQWDIKPLDAFGPKQSSKTPSKQTSIFIEVLDVLRSVILCFFAVWLVTTFIVKQIRIDGTSMYPTLHHGDYGFSNVIGFKLQSVKRFDVVVLYEPHLGDYVIKRIIGMPNEVVSYKDNQLYIDGTAVEEPFFDEEYREQMMTANNDYFTPDFAAVTLGFDEYFVMGDNRPKSSDSREYGAIHKDQIVSKHALIVFPVSHFGMH